MPPSATPSDPAPPGADLTDVPTEAVRLGALSFRARLIIALTVGGLAAYTVFHLAMVFLFIAPSNSVREDNWERIRGYIYPEFEQNWKLFAPNPLQRDEAVHVRAEVREPGGGTQVTDWIDLTAQDVEGIRHNLLPSHTLQNQLRRAWDFYHVNHDDEGPTTGMRAEVSASYLHRIAVLRLSETYDVDTLERIQVRSAYSRVPAPSWRPEDFETATVYEELDWWTVTPEDLPSGELAPDGQRQQREGEQR